MFFSLFLNSRGFAMIMSREIFIVLFELRVTSETIGLLSIKKKMYAESKSSFGKTGDFEDIGDWSEKWEILG